MNQPPPWDPQQPSYEPPTVQQPYPPPAPQQPFTGPQPPPFTGPQPGYQPPPTGPQPGRGRQKSWPARHKILTGLIAAGGFIIVLSAIGAAAASGTTKTVTVPGPTVTVTQPGTQVTVTVTATATATATVQATANAQGQATQISADGVYVIGQDIPGGTWHTSGGSQCYEATLASTDTSNIIDNNNFTGPDTVDLSGAKAFEINGGCTWNHEG